jgi:hypothetical protein
MTITTSKQLAEALGPAFTASADLGDLFFATTGTVQVGGPFRDGPEAWRVLFDLCLYGPDPRAAVLALADRLEAEARALRESVKEGP